MTPEELKAIVSQSQVVDEFEHPDQYALWVERLLAHIREQEVYVMAGKMTEKLSGTLDIINVGGFLKADWWWMYSAFESVRIGKGFDSWEAAVRDAHETLIKEVTE